jgi:hypothetical protein
MAYFGKAFATFAKVAMCITGVNTTLTGEGLSITGIQVVDGQAFGVAIISPCAGQVDGWFTIQAAITSVSFLMMEASCGLTTVIRLIMMVATVGEIARPTIDICTVVGALVKFKCSNAVAMLV